MSDLKIHLMVILLCVVAAGAGADPAAFEVDLKLQENARTWAEEFVRFAADHYQVELDWTDVSIKYLDEMVDDLHQTYVTENPPEEQIVPVARALGSYVAEVYRIYNGGSWGWVSLEDGSFPAVRTTGGATFLPLAKVLDRIKSGEDPDIWDYYRLLHSR